MTWYSIKTKKQSVTGSYGAWLSPNGDITPVDYQGHLDSASRILGQKFMSMKAEEDLLNMGYAALTFMGGLAVRHRKGLSDAQVKKIINLQKSENTSHVTIESNGERRFAKDPMELFSILTASKVTKKDINYRILKKATGVYGHWISPNGQAVEVPRYQGHAMVAKELNIDPELSKEFQSDTESLMELGWIRSAYEASEMIINANAHPTEVQAQIIQKLAQMAPKRISSFLFELPNKTGYIMRENIGQLSKIILSQETKALANKQNKITKIASIDLKELEKFLKSPDLVKINPENQLGNNFNFYDVQRYVMDSYTTKTAISKTKRKITVSILTTHGFLGSVAFNKYWIFEFSEWKKAIKTYKSVNEIVQNMVDKFIDEEITTTVFWPMLKYELDKLEPSKNISTNIPYVNYSRYYQEDDNPDWRQNIYGNRYPDYNEESYDQEIRRKGVFFD